MIRYLIPCPLFTVMLRSRKVGRRHACLYGAIVSMELKFTATGDALNIEIPLQLHVHLFIRSPSGRSWWLTEASAVGLVARTHRSEWLYNDSFIGLTAAEPKGEYVRGDTICLLLRRNLPSWPNDFVAAITLSSPICCSTVICVFEIDHFIWNWWWFAKLSVSCDLLKDHGEWQLNDRRQI